MQEESTFQQDNKIIYISGDIDETKSRETVLKLFEYNKKNVKDITLIIDSEGGDIYSFFAIHDAIKLCTCDVITVCIGRAMSCGQLILMSGTPGKRYITANSQVMMHQLSIDSLSGTFAKAASEMDQMRREQDIVNRLTIKYTKITMYDLLNTFKTDAYFNAEETIKYGLADKIIEPKDIYYI